MGPKCIAVIGAGASGLAAIKCCLDEGLFPLCFERNDDLGGLWRYEESGKNGATVYKSTVINTSKELMSYSDFPMPKDWPNFLHHSKVQEYYRSYANRILKTKKAEEETIKEHIVDGVLVAVGHHADPYFPKHDFPGTHLFQGQIIHSQDYRTFKGFENKNILVIGIGNSGSDIAVELSLHAKQVYLSTRRGAWVFGRIGPYGIPADFFGVTRYQKLMQDYLPEKLTRSFIEDMLMKKFDHAHYGLRPEHGPFNQPLTMNDDLPSRIITGSIKIKCDVRSIKESTVLFKDDTEENVDCIIFATGYKYSFPFLSNSILDVRGNEGDLYKYMWPMSLTNHTLAVIGHVQASGAVNPISEIQCRWATRVFKGIVKLPSQYVMWKDIRYKRKKMKERFYASQRRSIEVDHVDYMDQIAEQIGVKPNLVKLFFTDYKLAKKLLYEVSSSYQYRLTGPGQWKPARATILTQKSRMLYPLHTRVVKKHRKQNSLFMTLLFILSTVVLACIAAITLKM